LLVSKDLSNQRWRSIFSKWFSRIKATRFDKYQLYFAMAFNAVSISIVIKAVYIWTITAILLVPINDLICSNCLMPLKKISTSQRLLYSSAMVLHDHFNWLVIGSMICFFSPTSLEKDILSNFDIICENNVKFVMRDFFC